MLQIYVMMVLVGLGLAQTSLLDPSVSFYGNPRITNSPSGFLTHQEPHHPNRIPLHADPYSPRPSTIAHPTGRGDTYEPRPPPPSRYSPKGPAAYYPKNDYEGTPRPYSFNYDVKDDLTGADFGHTESFDGEAVSGSYRVALPDGRIQIVTYTADPYSGYQADVTYEGTAAYPSYNAPAGPAYSQATPSYTPAGPSYTPARPSYTPAGPSYTPAGPSYVHKKDPYQPSPNVHLKSYAPKDYTAPPVYKNVRPSYNVKPIYSSDPYNRSPIYR